MDSIVRKTICYCTISSTIGRWQRLMSKLLTLSQKTKYKLCQIERVCRDNFETDEYGKNFS